MCCDDAYLVTPRISALAGCDRLVSEPLVIENYSISKDPEVEPIDKEPLEEPKEEGCPIFPIQNLDVDWLFGSAPLDIGGSRGTLEVSSGAAEEGEVVCQIEAMKNWKVPKTSSEIRSFLGLAVYCDTSNQGLGYVLMQRAKVIAYRLTTTEENHEKNYTTQDFKMSAVVFAFKTWRHYLYGTKSVIYTDHKSFQHICVQKELNMRQRRWIELFSDYDCEIRYHPGKANVVVDAFSRKEKVKPRRVRAMSMTIRSSVMDKILSAQGEASKDGIPLIGDVRKIIMDETHASRYLVHPGADKTYYDLGDMHWSSYVAKALGTRLDMSTAYHPQTDGQSKQTIQTLEDILRACGIDFGDERLKAARDHQKSYADNRRKPLEFEVGDQVLLKVSPWKGVVCFKKKGKLGPRYVGPFEILERIGPVAYRLRLPQELSGVHDTFHVSNLKKCLADANFHVPPGEVKINKTLCFVEEPVEIMDRKVKKLKRSRIPIVKVRWNSKRGPKFTWERVDFMKAKYPK
ncbi:putative reverse transcriptase domain-containing protein [Tanacetum coccineum]